MLKLDWDVLEIHPFLFDMFTFLIWIDQEIQSFLLNESMFLRSQMISLFAYMETMFCLLSIYEFWKEISKDKIIMITKDNTSKYIKKYILNLNNSYYKDNLEKLKWINPKSIKMLRNMLTHFYSVPESLWVIQDGGRESLIASQKLGNTQYYFISPQEFYGLLQWACKLILEKWNKDAKFDAEFKKRMYFVMKIVWWNAAKIAKL